MKSYIELLHIKHWLKNIFVVAPLIFSFNLLSYELVIKTIYTFFAFSFSSSFVYILNNISDRKKDAEHPVKRHRPIASGRVTVRAAVLIAILLLIPAVVFLMCCNKMVLTVIVSYIGMNFLYSIKLRQIPILDVCTVSMGFLLRILAGSYAIGVSSSDWILLTTFFLALFISFNKRRSEFIVLNDNKEKHRMVFKLYSLKMLELFVGLSAALSIISYALYAISPETSARFGAGRLVFTVPLVLFGIFRYIMLTYNDQTKGEPIDLILKDRTILIIFFSWLCLIIFFVLTA